MEPAAAAAAYGAEKVAEGGIAVAHLLSKPTLPLRARFYKLPSVSTLARTGHSLNVIRGKAYIYGGDRTDGHEDQVGQVFIVTLPSSLELGNIDYQSVAPINLSQSEHHASVASPTSKATGPPASRSTHTTTSIGTDIYIFGGRPASSPDSAPLSESGSVHCFSTSTLKWTTLTPNTIKYSSGTPLPRTHACMTSSLHPLPSAAGEDQTLSPITSSDTTPSVDDPSLTGGGGGTLFLHGGFDSSGVRLTDTWAFDIPSRIWTRYPDLPELSTPLSENHASSYILHSSSSLIQTGPEHTTLYALPLSLDKFNDMSGEGELGVSPKPPGTWQAYSLIPDAAAIQSQHLKALHLVEEKMGPSSHPRLEDCPPPRAAGGLVAMSTGAGREYAILLPGPGAGAFGSLGASEEGAIWTLQLPSDKGTGAAVKDRIRSWFGKESGMGKWVKCDVVQTDKEDGVLPVPKNLERYSCDSGGDWGSREAVVLWGGMYRKEGGGELTGDGWVISFA